MECCGQKPMGVDLQVAGQPYVLYRCERCDTSTWTRDGEKVDLETVTQALQAVTAAQSPRTPRNPRTRVES